MRPASPLFALMLLAVTVAVTPYSHACSCPEQTVPRLFERAAILMLVRIGPAQRPQASEQQESWRWPFEVIEIYKGQLDFNTLSASGNGGMCGPRFVEGEYYLVSTSGVGRVGQCSVSPVGTDPNGHPWIRVLNAHKYGRIKQLTSPWYFEEFESHCTLFHVTASGGGRLHFVYRTKTPGQYDPHQYPFPKPYDSPQALQSRMAIEGSEPHPFVEPGYLALQVYFRRGEYLKEGTASLTIGDKEWPTVREPMHMASSMPYEVINAVHAREILVALADASSLSVSYQMEGVPDYDQKAYPRYPHVSMDTPVLFFEDSLSQFAQCVARNR